MASPEVCEYKKFVNKLYKNGLLFTFYDTNKLMSDCIYGAMKAKKKSVFLFSLNFRKKT